MNMTTLRHFESGDISELLQVWAKALPLDTVNRNTFEKKVLLDVNRETGSLILAENDGRISGFALRLVLRKPIENVGLRPETGYITAFGVDPEFRKQGIGSSLLENSIKWFKNKNRQKILIAPYTPNYFVPGIDKENYADGVKLFEKFGFTEYSEAIAMDGPISTYTISEKSRVKNKKLLSEGIEVRALNRSDILDYLNFQDKNMPGPWLEDARRNLVDLTRGAVDSWGCFIAVDKGKIIGFCQHEGSHFGPFGVMDEYQGRGIGSVLLSKTLDNMKTMGFHCAWVLWTGIRAANGVYGRLGFTITRKFAIMKKEM
jgi:mycothiol synthase